MRWKRARILLQRPFPELLRRQVAKAAHGPLLVEEADVIGDGLGDVLDSPIRKSTNISALAPPLMDSIALLSVGVPTRDIVRMISIAEGFR